MSSQRALPEGAVEFEDTTTAGGKYDASSLKIFSIVTLDDGNLVVTGCADGKVRVHDGANGKLKLYFKEHKSSVMRLAVLGNEDAIVSVDTNGFLCTWRPKNGEVLYRAQKENGCVSAVCSLEEGYFVVGTTEGKIDLMKHTGGEDVKAVCELKKADGCTVQAVTAHSGLMASVIYPSGDGFDSSVMVWDMKSMKETGCLRLPISSLPVNGEFTGGSSSHRGEIWEIKMDARVLVVATCDTMYVWERQPGGALSFTRKIHSMNICGGSRGIRSLTILGGTHVVTSSSDVTVLLTEIETRNSVTVVVPGGIFKAAITSDYRRIALGGHGGPAFIFPAPKAYADEMAKDPKEVMIEGKCNPSSGDLPDFCCAPAWWREYRGCGAYER